MSSTSLGLKLSLQQKLSPQQIQLMKLLEVPTAELEARIEEELEINPALEEWDDFNADADINMQDAEESLESDDAYSDTDDMADTMADYLESDDGDTGYKMQGDGHDPNEEDREMPIVSESSLLDTLFTQLSFLGLTEHQELIARQLIGSIDADGYIRRRIEAIVNDMAFTIGLTTDEDEVETILYKIQEFDPPGIAARDLRECLILQLKRKDQTLPSVALAMQIMEQCFDEFTKKHYDKIEKKLGVSEEQLKAALKVITKLNPKPGGGDEGAIRSQYIIPDFILTNQNGTLELTLNSKNAPGLTISPSYIGMLKTYDKDAKGDKKLKEAVQFIKSKLDAAKWFIDAIKQRQYTLLHTMQAIVDFQKAFFLEGDESKLKPMILKDIADKVGLDVSTVSRVANSKTVQTDFGIYPLKYFFTEGLINDMGEDVSTREVKNILSEIIVGENKSKPYADEELVELLAQKGFQLARRTVAKYREQLGIPVARLRKELM